MNGQVLIYKKRVIHVPNSGEMFYIVYVEINIYMNSLKNHPVTNYVCAKL